MNFKQLKNDRQYKVTKKYYKLFSHNYEKGKLLFDNVNEFILFMESIYRAIIILEAEIKDYEYRQNVDYNK